MHRMSCLFRLPLFFSLVTLSAALPIDFSTAGLSTQWTNSHSLDLHANYSYAREVRPILLRRSMGPSFACGFRSTMCAGACGYFTFSIMIVVNDRPSDVVWSANHDRPVQENATLQLSHDGDLVLRDADGSAVWSTNTPGRSVLGMRLTEIGTLELFDSRNTSVWSSIDYQTACLSTQWTNSPSLDIYVPSPDLSVPSPDGSKARAILRRGTIMGPSFACGFVCTGTTCNDFLFSIFIVFNSSFPHVVMASPDILASPDIMAFPEVVWSANREHPVKENATLELSDDGDLVLRDADGSPVWSTNTSGSSVVGMRVTDIGTLELFDRSNSSVWSSIDHPTDSWVLGQTLRHGQRLTANVSATNSTQGQLYLLSIVSGGIAAYVGSNPPQLYYENIGYPYNITQHTNITFTNGSLSVFTDSNNPRSPAEVYSVPLQWASSVQYMRLDYAGHLRLYEWDMNGYGWKLIGDVFELHECESPTVCGQYGICSDGVQCSCPAGAGTNSTFFQPVDSVHPTHGCSPMTALSCQSKDSHQLLPLRNVSYFDQLLPPSNGSYLDRSYVAMQGTDEDSCKEACMLNCSCKAAFFMYWSDASDGDCYLPSQLFSMSYNNPEIRGYNSSAFIKVQRPQSATIPNPPDTRVSEKKKASVPVIAGLTVGAILVASLVICLIIARARRKKGTEFGEDEQFGMVHGIHPARFSLEELKMATENFCRKLGGGGFGSVFEGTLGDGTRVAVKRLDGVGQGNKEFLAEVETIGSIHHINLVRLMGFCAEKSWRLLVYEFMSNGSLDKWIFCKGQNHALDWLTRRRIITDIAKGLAYLHEECWQKIAHLDIKPQNILLDEQLNAKVSDFGLSKLIDRDQASVMTRMRGTPGYLAPEWLTSVITEKADVYSFGVVVMEIVCGRKNLDYSQPEERIHLLSMLQAKVEEDRLSDLVDGRSSDVQQHMDECIEMMKLAMWCLQSDSVKRPPMSVVLKVLEGCMTADSDIDYKFSYPAPSAPHNANNVSSALPSASLLSGPR